MMEGTLIAELMEIPLGATSASVRGINMQMIDKQQAQAMLDADPNDNTCHECLLANGRFLFESENGNLKSLFKVK